jgi:uncharacterized membrane protein (DUF485 family)
MKKLFKVFEFVFFITMFAFLFSVTANAYIDPSVVTYTIQVGAGIIIAIGAVVGIYFRKAKKKINNKLGIDENKNKEVESDDIIIEEETKEEEKVEKTTDKEEKKVNNSSNKKGNNKNNSSKKNNSKNKKKQK